jgi:hypothetical protein
VAHFADDVHDVVGIAFGVASNTIVDGYVMTAKVYADIVATRPELCIACGVFAVVAQFADYVLCYLQVVHLTFLSFFLLSLPICYLLCPNDNPSVSVCQQQIANYFQLFFGHEKPRHGMGNRAGSRAAR